MSLDLSFAEVALRLGGASEEEAKRTGTVDTADDQVEGRFADRYKMAHSPIHRAVLDREVLSEVFDIPRSIEDERSVAGDRTVLGDRHTASRSGVVAR